MVKRNPFAKECNTGRKDQFDIDYPIFRKSIEETATRNEFIECLEEKLKFVITKISKAKLNRVNGRKGVILNMAFLLFHNLFNHVGISYI